MSWFTWGTNLHEETGNERLPDVNVVVPRVEVGGRALQIEPVHDARQLRAHVVRRRQRPVVDEVLVAPLRRLVICTTR